MSSANDIILYRQINQSVPIQGGFEEPHELCHGPKKILNVTLWIPSMLLKSLHTCSCLRLMDPKDGIRSVPTDPMRIWGLHKILRSLIQESRSVICTFSVLHSFWFADPDQVQFCFYLHLHFPSISNGSGSEDLNPLFTSHSAALIKIPCTVLIHFFN